MTPVGGPLQRAGTAVNTALTLTVAPPLTLALALALALTTTAATTAAITVRDDDGHTLTLPGPAQRAVALAPHLAELVFAAGAGQRLVGVMRFSDLPPEAAALPVIGDAFAINLEAVAA